MKREFVCQNDQSSKFWTVEVSGSTVITTNGRIGASPRETRKVLPDHAAAEREAAKLVAAKVRGGYVEQSIASAPKHEKPDWAAMAMSEEVFWRLIKLFDWKKVGDDEAVMKPACRALAQMSVADIERFEDILAEKLFALDTEAHARNIGQCAFSSPNEFFSVDTFLYARCVVVANGESLYQTVLADPEQMPKDLDFESLLTLASDAFTEKTGTGFEYTAPTSYETFANLAGWSKALPSGSPSSSA